MRGLSFSYSTLSAPVLQDVSLDIPAGAKAAIVGPSGSGKSTLGRLLVGLHSPTEGEVRLSGHPVREFSRAGFYGAVAYVPQSITLDRGSVRDNIAWGSGSLDDEQVSAAARKVGLHDEIAALPLGYDTPVAQLGQNFSGGQRQRIALARAAITSASVVVLDEATSSLDTRAERLVTHCFDTLGVTQVVIAHRLSTIVDADVIFVMDQGRLVEQGTHDELLRSGDVYPHLYARSVHENGTASPVRHAQVWPEWCSARLPTDVPTAHLPGCLHRPDPNARRGKMTLELVAAVHAADLHKTYGQDATAVAALRGVSVTVPRGQLLAVMGPSGSGKSTLLQCLAGLDRFDTGRVWIDDVEITGMRDADLTRLRRDRIGFIFQSFNLLPALTVEQNIVLPLELAGTTVDRRWFDEVVETLRVHDRLRHRPHELSGGQQQRVAVARALLARPAVVFADEPTGNLDSVTAGEVLALLRDSTTRLGQTVVMVTHDPVCAAYADRVVVLADGLLVDELTSPTVAAIGAALQAARSTGLEVATR